MTKDEALKLALEAIENMSTALREDDVLGNDIDMLLDAITALQEAPAEQPAPVQQEPVACRYGDNGYACCEGGLCAAEEHNYKTDWQERGMVAEAALAKLLYEKGEPVAVVSGYYGGQCVILPIDPARIFNSNAPLYTTPPQRPWVGLTQQDIDIAFDDTQEGGGFDDFARAIEAKLKAVNGFLKEKNT